MQKNLHKLICVLVTIAISIFAITYNVRQTERETFDLKGRYSACLSENVTDQDKGICLKEIATKATRLIPTQRIGLEVDDLPAEEKSWCHEFMHYVGWEILNEENNLPESFARAASECDSGMHHGIVEEYVKRMSDLYGENDFQSYVKDVCETGWKKENVVGGEKNLCNHGLGHGFLIVSKNNLAKALEACDVLRQGVRPACYSGVFMESAKTKQVGNSAESLFLIDTKKQSPDYPCKELNIEHKNVCYRYIGSSSVLKNNGTNKDTFKKCLLIDPEYKNTCFWGIGSNTPHPGKAMEAIAHDCLSGIDVDSNAYPQCISGAISFISQMNTGNPKILAEFCGYLRNDYKDLCYQESGATIADWSTSSKEAQEKCLAFSDPKAVTLCQTR